MPFLTPVFECNATLFVIFTQVSDLEFKPFEHTL